jgi:hypothetical protein
LAERLGEVMHPGNHQNGGQQRGSHPPPASLRNGVVSTPGGSR